MLFTSEKKLLFWVIILNRNLIQASNLNQIHWLPLDKFLPRVSMLSRNQIQVSDVNLIH